jgi:hypothetical protein
MRNCSVCHTNSPDQVLVCPTCQSDLTQLSTVAVALKELQENPRVVNIRVVVANDACPTCQTLEGTYSKNLVPILPEEGCSHTHGCRCFYEPMLTEVYP